MSYENARLFLVLPLIGTIFFLIFSVTAAMAQVPSASFSSSPNPLGSGARVLGFGNAFIAVADDATAASWNPGGLIQLETPEVSLVLSYSSRADDCTFSLHHEADRSNHDTTFDLNYFSAVYPVHIRQNPLHWKNRPLQCRHTRLRPHNKSL